MMMSESIGDGSSYLSSRPPLFAVDDDRVLLAQLGASALGRGVVGSLQILVVGRHGGVRDAELLSHRRTLLVSWAHAELGHRRR